MEIDNKSPFYGRHAIIMDTGESVKQIHPFLTFK
jgi:hypothetical protein